MEDLFAYINTFSAAPTSVNSSPAPLSSFSATHLKDLLDKLLLAVVPHLRHELETLTVDKLAPYMRREDLIAMDKVLMRHILARPAGETLPGESPHHLSVFRVHWLTDPRFGLVRSFGQYQVRFGAFGSGTR